MHVLRKQLLHLLPGHKEDNNSLTLNLVLKISYLLLTCILATFSLMFSNRNFYLVYCVLLSCPNSFVLIYKGLGCFAQFSQIEQRNIMLMSGNDGKAVKKLQFSFSILNLI